MEAPFAWRNVPHRLRHGTAPFVVVGAARQQAREPQRTTCPRSPGLWILENLFD
jgi:hypothetical protein